MKLKGLLQDKQLQYEVLRYLISGVLTTLVNLFIFTLLCTLFGMEKRLLFNTIAIAASILFAYGMNRLFVFRSEAAVAMEFVRFVSSRLLISLIFDNGGLFLLYDVLQWHAFVPFTNVRWAKVIGQFFVVAGNYIVGKIFVFAKKKT